MTEFRRVQGDNNDKIVAYLYGVASFTGSTAIAHVWQTGVATVNLTAAVVDGVDDRGAACGVCTVQLGTWLASATPTSWFVEYEVTFPDASRLTWPARTPDVVFVRPQGA